MADYAGRIIKYVDKTGDIQYDMITTHRNSIYDPWLYGAINLSNDRATGYYFAARGSADFYETPDALLKAFRYQFGKIIVIKKDEYVLSLRENVAQNA